MFLGNESKSVYVIGFSDLKSKNRKF